MKDDRVYLEHILDSIRRIETYSCGGWDEFARNPMAQDAVVRNFEIIGEAAKRLSGDTTARQAHIRWRDIAGFRDVLIHNYMGVNLARVWRVIQQDLPGLKRAVDDLLKNR